MKLSKEEKGISKSVESGEWESVTNFYKGKIDFKRLQKQLLEKIKK